MSLTWPIQSIFLVSERWSNGSPSFTFEDSLILEFWLNTHQPCLRHSWPFLHLLFLQEAPGTDQVIRNKASIAISSLKVSSYALWYSVDGVNQNILDQNASVYAKNSSLIMKTENQAQPNRAACDQCSIAWQTNRRYQRFVGPGANNFSGKRKLKCSGELTSCSRCRYRNFFWEFKRDIMQPDL